jgi:hypothetical protein
MGTSSRVSCYVCKNSLLLLYSSGSSRPSSFNYGNECASFPQTRYVRKCSPAWKSTIGKCFLIWTPCLMCIAVGTTVEEVDVCHLSKRGIFSLHHESNTSNHFNSSIRGHPATAFMAPLSVHVTLLMHLLTGYQLLHTLPYTKRYS